MEIKVEGQKEKQKITLMAVLLAGSCFLTYYFHEILQIGTVFTHLFYIPIILASLWWKRKGVAVALFLALFLLFSHYILREYVLTANDYLRALMFVVIGSAVALLSERIAKAQEKAVHLNRILYAIRNVNQLITKEKDSDRLLKGACDNLTQTRGYYNAWLALFDEKRDVVTTAESGLGKDFLPMVERLRQGELTACGQKALGQAEVVVTQDPPSFCTDCPLSDKYSGRGAMTMRLEHKGKVYGLLSTSIPAHFTADTEEQTLFKEVSRDIAFALHSIEMEEERKQTEAALRESEAQKKAILDASVDRIRLSDTDMRIIWANETHARELDMTPEELVGKICYEVFVGRDSTCPECPAQKALKTGTIEHTVLTRLHEGEGEKEKYLDSYAVPLKNESGEIVNMMMITRDITARKQAQDKLTASLREKEVLLKEVHHRVKNNMQVISSLLNLQSQHITDKASRAMFQESQNRVRSMALIHEKLYTSEDLAHIDIAAYIHDLTAFLLSTYPVRNKIKVNTAITDIFCNITTAIPCGLIINELVSNALKHAFPQKQKGTITVSMTPSNKDSLILTVSDTGIGFPEAIDFRNTTTLGLQLVTSLVEQVEGTITLDRSEGTRVQIEFKRQQ